MLDRRPVSKCEPRSEEGVLNCVGGLVLVAEPTHAEPVDPRRIALVQDGGLGSCRRARPSVPIAGLSPPRPRDTASRVTRTPTKAVFRSGRSRSGQVSRDRSESFWRSDASSSSKGTISGARGGTNCAPRGESAGRKLGDGCATSGSVARLPASDGLPATAAAGRRVAGERRHPLATSHRPRLRFGCFCLTCDYLVTYLKR